MGAGRNFNSQVSHVQPGSAVSASNTSKATRQLEQRTNYLREIIEAVEAGRLLVRRDQALHTDVVAGDAVFWDSEEKHFDRALAAVENNETTGTFVPTASSDCLGICMLKESATSGIIATVGMVKLPAAVLSAMTGGDTAPGRYYLSAASPGKLVRQRPPVTVAVAYVLGPADDCETDS